MICTKCNSDGVLVTIFGKDSWYCRTCKTDILPQAVSPTAQIIPNINLLNNYYSKVTPPPPPIALSQVQYIVASGWYCFNTSTRPHRVVGPYPDANAAHAAQTKLGPAWFAVESEEIIYETP